MKQNPLGGMRCLVVPHGECVEDGMAWYEDL